MKTGTNTKLTIMDNKHKISEWENKQPYNVWFAEMYLQKGYVTKVKGGIKGRDVVCLVWDSAGECRALIGERQPWFDIRW